MISMYVFLQVHVYVYIIYIYYAVYIHFNMYLQYVYLMRRRRRRTVWRFPLEYIYIYIGELTSLQQFVKTRSSDASYCLHTTCEERKKEAKIYHHLPTIHSLKLTVRPSKWMVGRRLSYWRGLFSGAISFREGKSINDYSLGQRTMK